jgi:hypothetical protein
MDGKPVTDSVTTTPKNLPEWVLKGIAEGWIHYGALDKPPSPRTPITPTQLPTGLSASELFVKWKDEEE